MKKEILMLIYMSYINIMYDNKSRKLKKYIWSIDKMYLI